MVNLEKVIRYYLQKNIEGCIFFNDELTEFKEFYEIYLNMELETVIDDKDKQSWYLLMNNRIWHKVSVRSLEEIEEEELLIQ